VFSTAATIELQLVQLADQFTRAVSTSRCLPK